MMNCQLNDTDEKPCMRSTNHSSTKTSKARLFSLLELSSLLVLSGFLGACSSSNDASDTIPVESQQVAEDPTNAGTSDSNPQSTGNSDETDTDDTPVTPVTTNPETTNPSPAPDDETVANTGPQEDGSSDSPEQAESGEPVTELSPIELMLNEITFAAVSVLHQLNDDLSSGQASDSTEIACLGDFDPALGRLITSINCPSSGLATYNSITQTTRVELVDSDVCQAALSERTETGCTLTAAAIDIPIEWVETPNSPASQIASVQPISGVAIAYNLDANGLLNLQSNSDVVEQFDCNLDIATASLLQDQDAACRRHIDAVTRRLFDFSQAQADP